MKRGKQKGLRVRNAVQRPDEAFSFGPFRMMRFGRHLVSQTDWSPKEFDKFQARLVADYDSVVQAIDRDIADASALVATLDPLAILHRAWWERSAATIGIDSEVELGPEHAQAARMLDYVQSLVAGTPPIAFPPNELTDEAWNNLQQLVEAIFQKLNSEYFLCTTAKRRQSGAEVDSAFEEFHFLTQLYWCNVRGEQYQNHHVQALRELLAPQTDALQQLYGLSSAQLCDELEKIWHSLTKGIFDAFDAMDAFRLKSLAALDADINAGVVLDGELEELFNESLVRHELEAEHNRAVGLFFFYDLFDLQKVTDLPLAFLDDFSWAPGQDKEFFAEGPFKGWPLRVWPIFKRPFIKLDGRYYCFDLSGLFDHFYRQLEKRMFAEGQRLKQAWIEARKEVTETLPFVYMQRLLPGAICFKEIYYWLGEAGTAAARYETDGVLVIDDHLFIVEIKSGSFTYTSPATDVDAHVQSIKNLVSAPAKQGNRFLRYLQSADEVPLLDHSGNETARLRLSDYRQVTICAITLDPFTEIAAQVQHLSPIGIDVGDVPVWSLSLDDLRVYSDVFVNPLEFLHYVQVRTRALKSDIVQLDDELDHLGLYLQHNHYPKYADELHGGAKAHLQFIGYRQEIDRFFAARLADPALPSPLRQRMPTGMAALLEFLTLSGKTGRSAIAAYLLDLSGEWRDSLFNMFAQEARQSGAEPPRPFSTYGEVRLTAFACAPGRTCPSADKMRDHVRAIMVMHEEPDRVLLALSYDDAGAVHDAEWHFLRSADITVFELPAYQAKGEVLRRARLKKAIKTRRRIGRNEPCPCGSGKKFKKCCGPALMG
ncbi:SEC-C metal-binding domain-containing protein [Methyloversatilis discipulorum]|uniref:YecA/YgfB family protein n=1 Tax=Methyloversatilis discipulorum TaxID=1119528 RepID=UPI000B496C48|nr:SEC-C metal-binding domain-containing protein [Methyloversatilis discipulorum]